MPSEYSQAAPATYLFQGLSSFELAVEGEDHVVGVEIAGRGEEVGGLELDARAQLEGVYQAVVGDVPAFGEARLKLGAAVLELDQAVVDRARRGVEGGAGGIERRDRSLPGAPPSNRPASLPKRPLAKAARLTPTSAAFAICLRYMKTSR